MDFWEKIRKDVQKGYKEGLAAIKEGSIVVRKKADELAVEGKKQLKLFELKQKVQSRFTDLGGRVYELIKAGNSNPAADEKVQSIIEAVDKIEVQIHKLEEAEEDIKGEEQKSSAKKATVERKSRRTAQKPGVKPVKRTAGKPAAPRKRTGGVGAAVRRKKNVHEGDDK